MIPGTSTVPWSTMHIHMLAIRLRLWQRWVYSMAEFKYNYWSSMHPTSDHAITRHSCRFQPCEPLAGGAWVQNSFKGNSAVQIWHIPTDLATIGTQQERSQAHKRKITVSKALKRLLYSTRSKRSFWCGGIPVRSCTYSLVPWMMHYCTTTPSPDN